MSNQFVEKVLQNAVTSTATGEELVMDGYICPAFQLSGTFTATVTFEATVNGTDWHAIRVYDVTNNSAATTKAAAGIFYTLYDAPYHAVRARVTTYTGGPVTVWARAIARK